MFLSYLVENCSLYQLFLIFLAQILQKYLFFSDSKLEFLTNHLSISDFKNKFPKKNFEPRSRGKIISFFLVLFDNLDSQQKFRVYKKTKTNTFFLRHLKINLSFYLKVCYKFLRYVIRAAQLLTSMKSTVYHIKQLLMR